MQTKKAFTIVELLVVMAVIGVLLSLAVFGIQALQKSQRETQRQSDIRNLQSSFESFYTKYKRYPSYAEVVVTSPNFVINYIAAPAPAVLFATFPIQSLTPTKYAAAVTYTSAAAACTGALQGTADTWYFGYNVAAGTPQQYGLWSCTENGKGVNIGSKNT